MIESGTVTRSWQRQAFEPLEDEEESSALQQQFRKTLSQPDPPAPDYTLTVLQNLAMATSSEPPPQGSDSWMAAATAEPPETPAAIGTELPLPRSQSDAEAASNGAASDAGDRSADWAFIQRHDAYAARMYEFRADYSALSSFRGSVGQGFLDYANEMTLANLREPQWADEEFASIESQGWSLPEAAAKAAAGSSGQPGSSAQPAVNWAEADRADAAGSVDLRTASGHFVPDTQHDAVLAGINAERGINPHGTTPRGEEASPQFAEASSSGPTYGEFGEEIPPAQQIVIVGQRPPAYADTIAERIGGTLGALYNLGNALGEGIKDQVSDSQSSTSDLAAMRSARQAAAGATSSIAALDSSELTSPNTNAAELLGNLPELLVAPDTSSYYDDSDARTWSQEVQKRLDDTLKGNNEDFARKQAQLAKLAEERAYALRMSGGPRGGAGVADGDAPVWNMRDASAALRSRAPESSFSYGFNLGDRSVLDGISVTTEESVGRFLGQTWASTKSMVYGMTGGRSFDLAVADWRAGNYGYSVLHGMQSFGEAGLTLFGFGVGGVSTSATALAFPGAEATAAARATYIGNVGGTAALDAETLAARQATANAYYKTLGWDDARISLHTSGIDFSQSVDVVTLPKASQVVQYQIPGNPVGGYFGLVGTPAESLGISSVGREPVVYLTTEDVSVLRSTAANTSKNLNLPESARGAGGGTQLLSFKQSHQPFVRLICEGGRADLRSEPPRWRQWQGEIERRGKDNGPGIPGRWVVGWGLIRRVRQTSLRSPGHVACGSGAVVYASGGPGRRSGAGRCPRAARGCRSDGRRPGLTAWA